MDDRTFSYVTGRFRDYYRETELDLPPEIEKREWGFIPFTQGGGTRMVRHKSLLELGDPQQFLEQEQPQHVYASASKYAEPGAPTMDEKEWESSDLIFDIDIDEDHLPESVADGDDLDYATMLGLAKDHLIRLLHILEEDFGFEEMDIVFSGGRGYHVHIRDDRTQTLTSQQRTEIVSYIRGVNLDLDAMTQDEWAPVGTKLQSDRIGFSPTGGWSTRTHRKLVELMDEMLELPQPMAEEKIADIKRVGEKKAPMIYTAFKEEGHKIRAGEINVRPGMKSLARTLEEETREEIYAEIDEPVTTDINRLIRMPGTLHGGHGLEVMHVPREDLDEFDPLVDAVPETFQRQDIAITVTEPVTVELMGETYEFEEGSTRVPEAVGIHMMVEGWAEKDRE